MIDENKNNEEREVISLENALRNPSVNFNEIKELLKQGACVNYQDEEGQTPLHLTILNGKSSEVISELLKYGAYVNGKNKYDQTPLHLAVETRKNLEIIEELLKNGAGIDIKDYFSRTSLHIALIKSPENSKLIELLLKYGASVHEKVIREQIIPFALLNRKLPMNVIQQLLKHSLIQHSDTSYCNLCSNILSHCPNSDCYVNELNKMKHTFVLDKLTLYDFVVHKYDYDKLYCEELDELQKLGDLTKTFLKEYPNYHEIILNTIETKDFLMRKLCKYSVVFQVDQLQQMSICIYPECLYEIAKYLTRDDLRNFIKAISLK